MPDSSTSIEKPLKATGWRTWRWRPAQAIRRSLARRQAVAVMIASLIFALFALGTESLLDYRAHVVGIRAAPQRLIDLMRYPASLAAYRLDERFAGSIAEGMFRNPAVLQVSITDDFGHVLVDRRRSAENSDWRALSDSLFGEIRTHTEPLLHNTTMQRVGYLAVTFDPLVPATEFFNRLVRSLTISMVDIAAIMAILLLVTNAMTTRRLAGIANQLKAIDPSSPGQHRIAESRRYAKDEIDQLIAAINALLRNTDQRTTDLLLRDRALESIAQGVVIADARRPGNPLVYANPAMESITGYTVAESVDLPSRVLSGEALDPHAGERLRAAIAAGAPFRDEVMRLRKDGKWIWVDLSVAPLRDATGVPTHWVLIQSEVTERRNLESQLRQAQKMEAVGQLTGGVAHDFNNLLTVILGNAAMLAEKLADNPKLRGLAEMIRMAGDRGAALTRRLLAFARRQALRPANVDVTKLLLEFEPLLRRSVGETIDLKWSAQPDLRLAHVDPAQLESALVNLAINARDAMPDGGTLAIEASNVELDNLFARESPDVKPGSYVLVAVSDTGSGMTPDVQERAFEPFFTTKDVGKGSGLGLSMVYGFLKQSGGHAKIYSEPGHGTVVKLFLPVADAGAANVASAQPAASLPRGNGELVLMVDDDDLVRAHVKEQLDSLGYRVVVASNGREALQRIEDNLAIDLLFTDVVMPGGINGLQLSQKARERVPDLRVLFTSGYTENAVANMGELGADAMLLDKPYRLHDLATKIRAALDRPKAKRAPTTDRPLT
ncbi:MAG: ATP-binding protein [Alphaproteobacteria bacterium]